MGTTGGRWAQAMVIGLCLATATACTGGADGGEDVGATLRAAQAAGSTAHPGAQIRRDKHRDPYARTRDGSPVMPVQARRADRDGGTAFARWYLELIASAQVNPRVDALGDHALAGCTGCRAAEDALRADVAAGEHLSAHPFSLGRTASATQIPGGRHIEVAITRHSAPRLAQDGSATSTTEAGAATATLDVVWRDGRWRVLSLDLDGVVSPLPVTS